MRALTASLIGSPIIAQCLISPIAQAQDDPADIAYDLSVMERPLETQGIGSVRLGAWELTPLLDLGVAYDDNIYATRNNQVDDYITTVVPVVRLASDWNRHQTEFEIGGDFGRYQDNPDENYNDYYFQNSTVLDVVQGTQIFADLLYRHAHVPRTSANSVTGSKEPTKYDQRSAMLGITRGVGIFSIGVNGGVDRLTYSKGETIGGAPINNSDQDRTVTNVGARVSYEPFDDATAYLDLGYQDVDYDDSTIFGGPDRSNTGYNIRVGASKTLSDLWVIDLAVGYSPRDYKDSRLEDVTGGKAITLRGDLLWNPTALTSVMATIWRQSYETTEPGASAIISTFGALNVEHQLTRSLILNAGLDYNFSDYDGAQREDNDFGISAGLEYYLTRFVSIRADYSYRERDSNQNINDYDKNLAQIALRLSL